MRGVAISWCLRLCLHRLRPLPRPHRYLTLGSLRDQITYPLSDSEVAASGRSDADITAVLEAAYLQVGG